jgi:hypothetical protein
MVIKTDKGYIAIPPKKKKSTLALIKIAEVLSKKFHNTEKFRIISL